MEVGYSNDFESSEKWLIDHQGQLWAIQAVQATEPNYEWKESELRAINDGIVPLQTSVFGFLRSLADGTKESHRTALNHVHQQTSRRQPPSPTSSSLRICTRAPAVSSAALQA